MPTAVTRATRGLHHGVSVAGLAVVALLVTACSDDGDDPVAETTESSTPSPVITAPPTKSPEEQAEAEIIDTFETLIADRDEYYSNASDYGAEGDATWNTELVGNWSADGRANAELANWVAAWRKSGFEQVGRTVVATHDVAEILPKQHAQSSACLDMTDLSYQTYEGQPADLPAEPSKYQVWDMTWRYYESPSPEAGIEKPGWYVFSIDLVVDEPC